MTYEELFNAIKNDIDSKFLFFQADELVLYGDLCEVDFVGIDSVLENRHIPYCAIKIGDNESDEILDASADEILKMIEEKIEELGYSPPTMSQNP